MLKPMDHIRRCLAALLLTGLVTASLAGGAVHAELVDRIVAIVNDDIILQSDVEKAMAPMRARLKQQGYADARVDLVLHSEREAILEQMITDTLTDQQARRHGITVSDAEVDETIARIQQMNNVSEEDMARMLQLEGMTYEMYRDHLKEQLLRTRIVNREVKSRIVITDEAVRAYYEANRDRYAGQTEYHLRHILMRVTSLSPTERQQVRQEMERLHERLQQGEAFERLARRYSQADTAREGGDLGLYAGRLLAEPVREALQGLQAGQFTPVVETEQGYQLFYVEDVVHSGGRGLEEMKPEIQEKLYAEQVDERFDAWLAALRRRAHIQVVE